MELEINLEFSTFSTLFFFFPSSEAKIEKNFVSMEKQLKSMQDRINQRNKKAQEEKDQRDKILAEVTILEVSFFSSRAPFCLPLLLFWPPALFVYLFIPNLSVSQMASFLSLSLSLSHHINPA